MRRPIEHEEYGPGKFEGESCIARLAYHITLSGFGEPIGEDENDNTQRVQGPLSSIDVDYFEHDTGDKMCLPCFHALDGLDHVDVWESEQGFIYASA
jgi:hypothetical protein